MKVDSQEAPHGAQKPAPRGERFQKALQQAEPRRPVEPRPAAPGLSAVAPGSPRTAAPVAVRAAGPVLALARQALASPESLGRARQGMHVEAQRLGTVRSEAGSQALERQEHRLTELIARELARDARPAPPPVPPSDARPPPPEPGRVQVETAAREPAVGAAPSGSVGGEVASVPRAEAAVELIERIEVFVKSQRPALSLSLRGTLEATVEVERTGPREVALRIQGHKGPLPDEDVARLRDALEARGLRLRALRSE